MTIDESSDARSARQDAQTTKLNLEIERLTGERTQ